MRRRFCAGATWAQDRSSYNIYLFGGASIGNGPGFGDTYILSLPSFTWIIFDGPTPPHHSTTCNVIEGSQMIIMGGHFTTETECDVSHYYGMHGLSLGKENPRNAQWATFNPNVTTYKVPDEIVKTIGGGPTGAATRTTPDGGFRTEVRDLSKVFTRAYTPATRTPTRAITTTTTTTTTTNTTTSTSNHKSRKAVIGGAVGGTLGGLAVIAVLSACFIIYRKKKADAAKNAVPTDEARGDSCNCRISELPSDGLGLRSSTAQTQQSPYGSAQLSVWTSPDVYAAHKTLDDKAVHNHQYPQELATPTYMVELPALEAQKMPMASPNDSIISPVWPEK